MEFIEQKFKGRKMLWLESGTIRHLLCSEHLRGKDRRINCCKFEATLEYISKPPKTGFLEHAETVRRMKETASEEKHKGIK